VQRDGSDDTIRDIAREVFERGVFRRDVAYSELTTSMPASDPAVASSTISSFSISTS
jgi:hypothetical protein